MGQAKAQVPAEAISVSIEDVWKEEGGLVWVRLREEGHHNHYVSSARAWLNNYPPERTDG